MSSKTLDRLVSHRETQEIVCKSRTAIYHAVKSGEFPAPVQLGQRTIAWRESDLMNWINSRPVGTRPTGSDRAGPGRPPKARG